MSHLICRPSPATFSIDGLRGYFSVNNKREAALLLTLTVPGISARNNLSIINFGLAPSGSKSDHHQYSLANKNAGAAKWFAFCITRLRTRRYPTSDFVFIIVPAAHTHLYVALQYRAGINDEL